jgi:hypothetical protein
MKTIQVNGVDVVCSHEVKTDEKINHTAVHLTVKAGDLQSVHVMTIGSVDEPLPLTYDSAALQNDLDAFRQKSAVMAESRLRAKTLAQSLQ